MKRLYPQPVAHQPERLGGGIEKGEGEHAIEPVHALRSPLPPSMQDDFGIAVRAEYMAFGLQLRSDRREIINLAIEGQGKRAIVGQHRLRAACKRSEEHTSELQSLMRISYAVFCLKKKTQYDTQHTNMSYHRTI